MRKEEIELAFADKYRDRASKTLKNVVDKRLRNESGLDKIRQEEEDKRRAWDERMNSLRDKIKQEEEESRKAWEERKKKLKEAEAAREAELVKAWGIVVMASGFEDSYPENFELLEAIIRDAMERMKADPAVMDGYLAVLKDNGKDAGKETV